MGLSLEKVHETIGTGNNAKVRTNLYVRVGDNTKCFYIQGGSVYSGEGSPAEDINNLPEWFWSSIETLTDDCLQGVGFLRTKLEREMEAKKNQVLLEKASEEIEKTIQKPKRKAVVKPTE